MQLLRKIVMTAVKADTAFYLLPALMALLVVGTIAQSESGLFAAHQKYFASFLFWEGPVPLPGGYTLIGIFGVSLLLKFLFDSQWKLAKAGVHLTHLGAVIMLLGGLLTAVSAKEYFMILPEGGTSRFVYDYHQRQLMIADDENIIRIINFEDLSKDKKIEPRDLDLPFNLQILDTCENCEIMLRGDAPELSNEAARDLPFRTMAANMALASKSPEKEPEANLSGMTFVLRGSDDGADDGVYVAFEAMPKPVSLTAGGRNYSIIYGKAQTMLPFAIGLNDFIKDDYPGVDKARNFTSEIIVRDGEQEIPATITMNEPLRYGGYTFFQSSFDDNRDVEISVLSVVQNKGWLFPYIGALVIAAGLILHLILVARAKSARGRK